MAEPSVSEAVRGFLAGRELEGRDAVLGALVRALAMKIDEACESSASRDASALPPMVRRLLNVTAEFAERGEEEAATEQVRRMLKPVRGDG